MGCRRKRGNCQRRRRYWTCWSSLEGRIQVLREREIERGDCPGLREGGSCRVQGSFVGTVFKFLD